MMNMSATSAPGDGRKRGRNAKDWSGIGSYSRERGGNSDGKEKGNVGDTKGRGKKKNALAAICSPEREGRIAP